MPSAAARCSGPVSLADHQPAPLQQGGELVEIGGRREDGPSGEPVADLARHVGPRRGPRAAGGARPPRRRAARRGPAKCDDGPPLVLAAGPGLIATSAVAALDACSPRNSSIRRSASGRVGTWNSGAPPARCRAARAGQDTGRRRARRAGGGVTRRLVKSALRPLAARVAANPIRSGAPVSPPSRPRS